MSPPLPGTGGRRFVRLAETSRASVRLVIDGIAATALEGDTLLVALLTNGRRVRSSEFGDGTRAGFCLMGACQDCWVWDDTGRRLRACSTVVAEGLRVRTSAPTTSWLMTPEVAARLRGEALP